MISLAAADFDSGVYGALANAAAITTALQSIVALFALQRGLELGGRAAVKGTAAYDETKNAASRNFVGLGVLNLGALLVNGAVLAAWFKVGVADVCPRRWELWLPWFAVALGCVALTVMAAVGVKKLHRVAHP